MNDSSLLCIELKQKFKCPNGAAPAHRDRPAQGREERHRYLLGGREILKESIRTGYYCNTLLLTLIVPSMLALSSQACVHAGRHGRCEVMCVCVRVCVCVCVCIVYCVRPHGRIAQRTTQHSSPHHLAQVISNKGTNIYSLQIRMCRRHSRHCQHGGYCLPHTHVFTSHTSTVICYACLADDTHLITLLTEWTPRNQHATHAWQSGHHVIICRPCVSD